ncbi:hypothetical protein DRO42_05800, partial [Candidatus Bathyarchaeota archaeon]
MEFTEVVRKRRSIRRYKNTPVPKESILKVLEAARLAPSAGHRQPWHFLVVQDKATIEKLAGGQRWAADAPVVIVGLADPEASPSWCYNDLAIAFEHQVLEGDGEIVVAPVGRRLGVGEPHDDHGCVGGPSLAPGELLDGR